MELVTNMDLLLVTCDVMTLNRPGARNALLNELKRYEIGITAIQETRWLGERTHSILHSGLVIGANKEFGEPLH